MMTPRRTPCASCPYRRDVPSGIWITEEYDKLPGYDGSTYDQACANAIHPFLCHQRTNELCGGWVGCHDMQHNLSIRIASDVDVESVLDYTSPIPLFRSGAEAAAHGKREVDDPGPAAQRMIKILARKLGD